MSDTVKQILMAYCQGGVEGQTSQDIADNLRSTIKLEVNEITEYLMQDGYQLKREEDHLVWTDKKR